VHSSLCYRSLDLIWKWGAIWQLLRKAITFYLNYNISTSSGPTTPNAQNPVIHGSNNSPYSQTERIAVKNELPESPSYQRLESGKNSNPLYSLRKTVSQRRKSVDLAVLKLRSKDKEKGKRRRKSSRKKNRSEKVRDRFRIRDLEQYGFTNAALQNMFGEEMDSLLSLIEEVQTIVDEYDLEIIHKVPSLNAMWERYQYSEKILNEMNQKVKEISEMSNQPKERNEVSYIPPSKIIDESVLNQKRKMIVEEIIATEKSYYEALKIIQEEFE